MGTPIKSGGLGGEALQESGVWGAKPPKNQGDLGGRSPPQKNIEKHRETYCPCPVPYGGVRKTTYPKATKLAWTTEAAKSETGKPNWKANQKAKRESPMGPMGGPWGPWGPHYPHPLSTPVIHTYYPHPLSQVPDPGPGKSE